MSPQSSFRSDVRSQSLAPAVTTTNDVEDTFTRPNQIGHVTPYVVQDACSDKSCYHGARLHTSHSTLELAKHSGSATNNHVWFDEEFANALAELFH